MSKAQQRREEIKSIRAACEADGSLVQDFEQEGFQLTFNLSHGDVSVANTLVIPDSYPEGNQYMLLNDKGENSLMANSIKHAVQLVINEFAQRHGIAANPVLLDISSEIEPFQRVASTTVADDHETHVPFLSVVEQYNVNHTDSPIFWHSLRTGDVTMRFCMRPDSFLDPDISAIWNVHYDLNIVVELKVTKPAYFRSVTRPPILVYQLSPTADLTQSKVDQVGFGLAWLLTDRLTTKLTWPPQNEMSLFEEIRQKTRYYITNCNKRCVICDTELAYKGLKPAVCGNPLCVFSHAQYGLGEDVCTFIQKNPEVADMLICCTYATSQGDIRRFDPFPVGIEGRQLNADGKYETLSFMRVSDSLAVPPAPNPEFVGEVLRKLPPISDLCQYSDTNALRTALDGIHPLLFPLLRWIVTSNRAHLKKIDEDLQSPHMSTSRQFVMLSSPPETEAEFEKLKEKYGSFYCWHGSGFGNWHSILRRGLKNYSGTALMTVGQAYGPGIYAAVDSAVSFGYSHVGQGWPNSMTGTHASMQLIALCEVVDYAPGGKRQYTANPYYVIKDETHIMTRSLFWYHTGAQRFSVRADVVGESAQKIHRTVSQILSKRKAQEEPSTSDSTPVVIEDGDEETGGTVHAAKTPRRRGRTATTTKSKK